MKHLCDCGVPATWEYSPGFSSLTNSYFCDACVPRGCSCQTEGVYNDDGEVEDEIYLRDSEGRLLPCIEFEYCEEGFDEMLCK